jgi:LacI family asc operon transcriptional repressor
MATMLEVAKRAGVSKATVSRVLSGNGYVSQETKDRVFQAVAESGYRPNLLARNLATKKSQTLGLVVTNTLYHGVYFSELLFHVARMTEDKGRQLILADGKHSAEEEREAIQYLLDLRCDAIIIYPRFLSVDEMDESWKTSRSRLWCSTAACGATPATASGPIKKPRHLRRSKN